MHALELSYWWFQGRRKVILSVLADELARHYPPGGRRLRLLDVGCGTGMLLEDLRTHGTALGLDYSPVALKYCRDRGLDGLGRADAHHLPVRSASVDLITALDVVEHIRDDRRLMGEFFRVLAPGGLAVMSVPAHKHLWSAHDVALHHFRRYEKPEFRALVEEAGLHPVRYTHTFATVYPPVAVFRHIKKLLAKPDEEPRTDEFPLPGWVNSTLLGVMNLEARFLRNGNLPFGVSLLCVARKP